MALSSFLPRIRRQLDGTPHAGANCGPVSTAHALAWSTGGRVRPFPDAVRRAMGGRWSGPRDATSLSDNARAWATFRDDAREAGLRLGGYDRRPMAPWADVTDALDAGRGVVLQIDYRSLTSRRPDLSGDPAFGGLHVVFLARIRRRGDGTVEMLDYDGLYDGRRKGIPRGPQWVPAWVLRRAAERKVVRSLVAGGMDRDDAEKRAGGMATIAVVERSTPLPRPEPKPKPEPKPEPETCERRAERLAAELAACSARVDSLAADADLERAMSAEAEAHILALEVALGTARTALSDVDAAAAGVAAALADIDEMLPREADAGGAPDDGVGDET